MRKEIEGVDDVHLLVDAFYERVRHDELLAPVFNKGIQDWRSHTETMYDFWQALLLEHQTCSGSFTKHIDLPITNRHLDRWLTLFNQTVDEYFTGQMANEAKFRAIKTTEVFRYKLDLFRF